MAFRIHICGIASISRSTITSMLQQYALDHGSILESAHGTADDFDRVAILEAPRGNVSVLLRLPTWWDIQAYLITAVDTPILCVDMYEHDYWQYQLVVNGTIIDSFNPIPLFSVDTPEFSAIPPAQHASLLCHHWPAVSVNDVIHYYTPWNAADPWNAARDERHNAYPHDTYPRGNAWQIADFMRQLGLAFPLNEQGTLIGDTYRMNIPTK